MLDTIFLEVGNVYTELKFSANYPSHYRRRVRDIVRDVTKAQPDGYRFMPSYTSKRWDGYVRLLKGNKFPAGLTELVHEHLLIHAEDLEYEVDVVYGKHITIDSKAMTENILCDVSLRDYQLDAVRSLLGAGRGIAGMATNSGKTFVIAAICKLVKGKALILTHKKELLYQLSQVVSGAVSEPVGLVGDGNYDLSARITVATVQTLHTKLGSDEFKAFAHDIKTLMLDECHHTSSRTMYDTAMAIPAYFRFGFSGTPLKFTKLEDMKLVAVTGPVVTRVSNADLVEEGHSAVPTITMYPFDRQDDVLWSMKWHEAYQNLIVDNVARNRIVAAKAVEFVGNDKVVLVLVDRLQHQQTIRQIIRLMIISHGYHHHLKVVNGSDGMTYRNAVLDSMRSGQSQIVIATSVFEEGVDVPAVDVVILAAGGKSHIRLLQRIGRGLRKKSGPDNVVQVIDFVDGANKYLSKHSAIRLDLYITEGFSVNSLSP